MRQIAKRVMEKVRKGPFAVEYLCSMGSWIAERTSSVENPIGMSSGRKGRVKNTKKLCGSFLDTRFATNSPVLQK
jgi:hypothetical protein